MSVTDDTPPSAVQRNAPLAVPPALPVVRPGDQLLAGRGLLVRLAGHAVLRDVDLEVSVGETVAIVGRSGCGKTTLLHALGGLIAPAAGEVTAAPAALMPQRDGLMPWASACDNAALPLRIARVPRREARARAVAQLRALGLGEAVDQPVARLSGGMRQRVALARTLLTGRKLLLLDEPLASVDALTRSELHTLLLAHLAQDGHGAVLVTHDLDEAVLLADRILILRPDRSASGTKTAAQAGRAGNPVAESARQAGSTLRAGPELCGAVGERLEHRGGDALRVALLTALGARS